MTIATRGYGPLISRFTGFFTGERLAARMDSLLTASIVLGLASLAGIFGVAVWAVATR